MRLYINHLHPTITEEDLRGFVEPFGPIHFVNIHKDPETGESRGFAFVHFKVCFCFLRPIFLCACLCVRAHFFTYATMQKSDDAKMALEHLNGFEIAGQAIKVGLADELGIAGPPAGAPYMPQMAPSGFPGHVPGMDQSAVEATDSIDGDSTDLILA